jgi:hypothetical protein
MGGPRISLALNPGYATADLSSQERSDEEIQSRMAVLDSLRFARNDGLGPAVA